MDDNRKTDSIKFGQVAIRKRPKTGKNLSKQQISLNDTAASLQNLGKYSDAIPYLEKALEIERKSPILLTNLGISYAKVGKFTEAESLYDEALEIDPNRGEVYYNKACCKSMKGETKEALDLLEMAIKLDPEFRKVARTDEDFFGLRDLNTFKSLIS